MYMMEETLLFFHRLPIFIQDWVVDYLCLQQWSTQMNQLNYQYLTDFWWCDGGNMDDDHHQGLHGYRVISSNQNTILYNYSQVENMSRRIFYQWKDKSGFYQTKAIVPGVWTNYRRIY